jgi:hypothetical protein
MSAVRCGVRSGAYPHEIGSRASATLFRVGPTPTDGLGGGAWPVSPVLRGSGSVLVRTLIYLMTSSDRRRKSVGELLEHESRTIPVL